MKPPRSRFRLLTASGTRYFKTRQARDQAGQPAANATGEDVYAEFWSVRHPQDSLNRGWASDARYRPTFVATATGIGVKHATKKKPAQLDREIAEVLEGSAASRPVSTLLIGRKGGRSSSRRQRRFADISDADRAITRWAKEGFDVFWLYPDDQPPQGPFTLDEHGRRVTR